MSSDKTRQAVVYNSAVLMGFVVSTWLFSASLVRAQGGKDTAEASTMFRTKCAPCHGPDGSGNTPAGKSMNIPDLRSGAVQKLPDAELAQTIANGKGGMPPFKSTLNEDQIHALVAHIRSLRQKK
jgi:cytochrome c6